MRYEFAADIQKEADEISRMLFPHIKLNNVKCFRSWGTSTRNTLARCHGISKIMQKALGIKAIYALEFLSERFDKLDEEEKTKTIIHELMHIPNNFGGGFKHHDFVTNRTVNKFFNEYKKRKNEKADTFYL